MPPPFKTRIDNLVLSKLELDLGLQLVLLCLVCLSLEFEPFVFALVQVSLDLLHTSTEVAEFVHSDMQ